MIPRIISELTFGATETWGIATSGVSAEQLAFAERVLDPWERLCAHRLAPRPRVSYVLAHATLRAKAGAIVGEDPRSLEFRRTPFGRPELRTVSARLRFSISHTTDYAVVTLSAGAEIGVDVERLDRAIDPRVQARYSTASERDRLNEMDPGMRCRQFLTSWVIKEAITKANGVGLKVPFRSLEAVGDRMVRVAYLNDAHVAAVALQRDEVEKVESGTNAR